MDCEVPASSISPPEEDSQPVSVFYYIMYYQCIMSIHMYGQYVWSDSISSYVWTPYGQ